MRWIEIIGERQTFSKRRLRGITLRQLHGQKIQMKQRLASEARRAGLVARMYTSMDDVEQRLDLADKALEIDERKLDMLLKRAELEKTIKTNNFIV